MDKKLQKLAEEACNKIIEASLYWNGEDEVKNPVLKTARTLAGLFLEEIKKGENDYKEFDHFDSFEEGWDER